LLLANAGSAIAHQVIVQFPRLINNRYLKVAEENLLPFKGEASPGGEYY